MENPPKAPGRYPRPQAYVVDLMHSPGNLLKSDSSAAILYQTIWKTIKSWSHTHDCFWENNAMFAEVCAIVSANALHLRELQFKLWSSAVTKNAVQINVLDVNSTTELGSKDFIPSGEETKIMSIWYIRCWTGLNLTEAEPTPSLPNYFAGHLCFCLCVSFNRVIWLWWNLFLMKPFFLRDNY